MELYQLRTFVIVAEEENVTRAAKRLFTTPPSVSAHIKALEEELNVALFSRTPKGMQLTEKGKILKEKAKQTLRAAQDLANHATQLQAYLLGRIHFGLNATPAFLRVAELVTRLQDESPGIELHLISADSGQILADLKTRRLDAGYIFGSAPDAQIISYPLHTAELVIAAPAIWADKIERASWADLALLPWIASPYYCPFQVITEALFQKRGLNLSQVVQVGDETTKSELIKAGVGLALLEKGEAEQGVKTGKIVVWTTHPIYCDLAVAYLSERQNEPLLQALLGNILRLWGRTAIKTEPE
jgi:DNA-binding transcriptional LysR family regulator